MWIIGKLETKFFEPFQMLHPLEKQAYKLEPPKKWRIYDVFYILLLEQNTTKKKQMDENVTKLNAGDNKNEEYEIEAI